MKLLFFDIDGTLITEDKRRLLPESAAEAIKAARAKGHKAFINSGRTRVNIPKYICDVGFDGMVCGCGLYISEGDRVLYNHKLDRELCYDIARRLREWDIHAMFEHECLTCFDKDMMDDRAAWITDTLKYFISLGGKVVDDIESGDFLFDKFTAWYYDGNAHIDEFYDYVSRYFNPIRHGTSFAECVPLGHSKATGIDYLIKHYDVTKDDVYVFGDSNNDMDMMTCVPHSIAMGNSSPEILEVAMYVTDTVENDGIKKALEHFELV